MEVKRFTCNVCFFKTDNKKLYEKHMKSKKHTKLDNIDNNSKDIDIHNKYKYIQPSYNFECRAQNLEQVQKQVQKYNKEEFVQKWDLIMEAYNKEVEENEINEIKSFKLKHLYFRKFTTSIKRLPDQSLNTDDCLGFYVF